MDKKWINIALTLLVLFSGCAKEKEEPVSSEGCLIKVGIIVEQDDSVTLQVVQGIERFIKENQISDECYEMLTVENEDEYLPYLTQFAEQAYSLVILPTFEWSLKQEAIASIYPNTTFLVFNQKSAFDNVLGIDFKDEQAAFLAGVSAALKAKELGSNTVGFIGGKMNALSNRIQAGFEQGVFEIDAEMNILINYTDNLDDETIAEEVAYKQFEAGATVIYHTTSIAGAGIINEAKGREAVYVIGYNTDQYQEGFTEEKSVILTSTMKHYDEAAYQVANAILMQQKLNLNDFSVELELSEERNLSNDTIAALKDYAECMKEGSIVVELVPQVPIYSFEEVDE